MSCLQHIRFISRKAAATHQPSPDAVIISIHDRSEPPLQLLPGWSDVLVQRYHDTDGSLMGLEVFSVSQAREVLAFADQHRGSSEFIVHCQMGHSRSAAVALYLAEKFGVPCLQDDRPVTSATWQRFNQLVYARLEAADGA